MRVGDSIPPSPSGDLMHTACLEQAAKGGAWMGRMGGSEEAIKSLGDAPSWGRGPEGHSQKIRSRLMVPYIG